MARQILEDGELPSTQHTLVFLLARVQNQVLLVAGQVAAQHLLADRAAPARGLLVALHVHLVFIGRGQGQPASGAVPQSGAAAGSPSGPLHTAAGRGRLRHRLCSSSPLVGRLGVVRVTWVV